jgi:hypothetical protein
MGDFIGAALGAGSQINMDAENLGQDKYREIDSAEYRPVLKRMARVCEKFGSATVGPAWPISWIALKRTATMLAPGHSSWALSTSSVSAG